MKKIHALFAVVTVSLGLLAGCKSAPKHEIAETTLPPTQTESTVAMNDTDTMNLGASSAGRAQ